MEKKIHISNNFFFLYLFVFVLFLIFNSFVLLLNVFFLIFFVDSVAMFDQDHKLPADVIRHGAAGTGSMYLNKYFFYSFYCDSCPCPILF